MLKEKAGSGSRAHSRRSSASMSLQSAIPRRVALQQRTPLLHRLQSACDRLTLPVNRYGNDGNIAEPVNFNRPPEPPGGQTENRDFHLGIAENCPNNRDHRITRYQSRNARSIRSCDGIGTICGAALANVPLMLFIGTPVTSLTNPLVWPGRGRISGDVDFASCPSQPFKSAW